MTEDTSSSQAPPSVSGADIRTFLFADMRGYTRFTQEHGDDAASALAGRFADLVRDSVPEFEGELLELRGDEALSVFRSARQALRASVELQRRLRTGSDEQPAFPIGVGMGLDAGEAVPTHGGYRGASLNLAARLCALAKPGEILASEAVAHLAQRVDGLRLVEGRSATLKGMSRPVRFVTVTSALPLPPVPPPVSPRAAVRGRFRSRRTVLAVAAVVAAAVAVIALARGSSSGSLVPLSPNAVAKMNPASGRIVGDVAVGATPTALAGASTGLWVANFRDRTVTELPVRGSQRTLSAGGAPTGICAGAGFLWIALGFQDQVSRVSLRTGTPTAPITVGDGPDAIAFARGAAWIALRIDDTVERVSPSGVAGPPIKVGQAPVALAYAAPYLWVANSLSNSLSRINVQTGARILPDIPLSSPPSQILIYEGSIWVTSELGNTVTRLNPNTDGITKVITTGIPEGPRGIAGASNRVWVTSPLAATITEIDPRRNAAIPSSRLATNPDAIVSWHGSLWITGHPL